MKKVLVLALFVATLAQAGVIRALTYPVRHPIRLVKRTPHIIKVIVW